VCVSSTDVGRDRLDVVVAAPVAAAAAFVVDLMRSLPTDARGPAT